MRARVLLLAVVCLFVVRLDLLEGGPVRLVFDQGHGELPPPRQLEAMARALGLEVQTLAGETTAAALEGARILYLRAPSTEFTDAEAAAIVGFVKGGGSLLLVLDEERRQSLEKTRVNQLISPFGMKLLPDTEYLHNTGAVAKAGEINKADRQVPYSGGRAVLGGTPFAYQLDKEGAPSHPFGAYTRLDSGGRIVVLGEGMASLFLGDPKGVRLLGDPGGSTTYWGPDSAVFMTEVLTWLSSRAEEPDLTKIADPAVWRVHNRSATSVAERPGAVRLDPRANDGMAWLVGSDFSEGTIEIDLRGSNTPGQSFVGLALRGVDDVTYDVVYFRPFNFKNPEEPRRARAVQYVSMPKFPWERLRAESPGKYEAAVDPVPDPDGWFHARIVVRNRKISAYVDGAAAPSLVVTELSDRRGGRLGLWVGNGSDGTFANLRVTPDR